MIVAALILGISDLASQGGAQEAYFGHVGEACVAPDVIPDHGRQVPGVASPSPVNLDQATVIKTFISGADKADSGLIAKVASSKWLTQPAAQSCISAIRILNAHCAQEPLYLLGDLEIRLEWVCGRKVPYAVFFTISEGKISNVWAIDYTKPVTGYDENGHYRPRTQ